MMYHSHRKLMEAVYLARCLNRILPLLVKLRLHIIIKGKCLD